MGALLEIRNLDVRFTTPEGEVAAVSDFSYDFEAGECVGIVGESGAGKSQTFMAVMRLLAANSQVSGSALFSGFDLLGDNPNTLRNVRGAQLGMIFQDPMTSLTPHLKVGDQIAEPLVQHKGMTWRAARQIALELLDRVQVNDASRRLTQYPHELSGGMRQRVMIAIALACNPAMLIADEPTTALDVTVQAQILKLLAELKREKGMAMALITHDLGVVAGLADKVVVMYGGRIVEAGPVGDMLTRPRHPYTHALLQSMPRIDDALDRPLATIRGQPPNPRRLPAGCVFHPRCDQATERCGQHRPGLQIGANSQLACHHPLRELGT